VPMPIPTSRATTSIAALSGGNNRATALLLNVCPYRATSVLHRHPLGWSMEATTILTRGAWKFHRTPVKARTALPFECPFIELSRLDERAGNAESKLYWTG